MLFPKKVKFRKMQTGREHPDKVGVDKRGSTLSYGSYGLKSMTACRVRSNQIEAARKAIKRAVGKTGIVYIRIFPDRPFTSKPAEVKMGKGKGEVQGYMVQVRPGRIIFEVEGVTEAVAKEALRKGGTKLPLTCKVISRNK